MDEIINEYLNDLDIVYGIYLDSIQGYRANFHSNKKAFEDNPNQQIFILGKDDGLKETKALHNVSLKNYLQRNATGNLNEVMIGNFCIIVIYQLWEDNFRQRIADIKGIAKNDVKIDSFGELRKIRQAIVHNNFKITSELKRLKLFNFFETRKNLFLTNRDFEIIVSKLKVDLRELLKK